MRRSYDPYVYVECPVCEERWWYNPYASGEAGLKICRNNKNHQIKMVTALGGKFGTPKPVYKHEVSGQTEQNSRSKTNYSSPPKLLSPDERYRQKIESRERRIKEGGKEVSSSRKSVAQKITKVGSLDARPSKSVHKTETMSKRPRRSQAKRKRETIGDKLRFEVFSKCGFRCYHCGRSPKEDKIKLEIDHLVPHSKGGSDDIENLVTACRRCNSGKSDTEL